MYAVPRTILTRARVRAATWSACDRWSRQRDSNPRSRASGDLWAMSESPTLINSNPRSRASGDLCRVLFATAQDILTRARVRAATRVGQLWQ